MTQTLVHDLRAPLSNSMFALEMLEMHLKETTPEAVRMIRMTISNTEKVLERVNKILDVERLSSHQMPLAFSAVSLPTVIQSVLDAQASRIAEKRLDIVTSVPETLALVWADAGLLERVLQNLVDNCIKFTPVDGEIVLAATAVPHSDPAAVHISIADTGTGIPQQLHETIFDKFASSATKGSSGLGLAFCKMAIAAHGHDIWVDSEPGQGSIFTFSLALAAQTQPQKLRRVPA
jgi:signal transduction histidine kinase